MKEATKKGDTKKQTELQKQLEYPTDDGDKLYIIMDEINSEAIKFRMVLCRMDALPYVEKNGVLTFLTEYLPKDFSLAEITHCVIFYNDGIMGAEFNYAGARASFIGEYIMIALGGADYVTCRAKINEEAFKQIIDDKPYGYFALAVKNTPEMKKELAEKLNIFSVLMDKIKDVDEYEVVLQRRITKEKKGFDAPLTIEEMENFIKNYKDHIKEFKISQGAKKDSIDLINDKLVCKAVMVKTKNKTIDSKEAYGKIISYYSAVVKNYGKKE